MKALRRIGRHFHLLCDEHESRARRGDDGGEYGVKREVRDEVDKRGLSCRLRSGCEKDDDRHEEDGHAADDREGCDLGFGADLHRVVLGHLGVLFDRVMERLERVDGLLEDLDHGNAAHVFRARLGHVDESLLIALHEVRVLASHHGEHAHDGKDRRQKARKAHAPVEDEEQRHHPQHHGDRPHRVRRLVGDKPLGRARAPVDYAAQSPRCVGVEVTELHFHQVCQRCLPQVAGGAEGAGVGAKQREEVHKDARHREPEGEPSVCRQVGGSRPVGSDGYEIPRHQPDADIGSKSQQHRDCRENATQVEQGLSAASELEKIAQAELLLGRLSARA